MCVDVAVRSLLTIACCFEIDAVAVGTQADTVKCLRLQLPFLNLRTRTYTHTYMKSARKLLASFKLLGFS